MTSSSRLCHASTASLWEKAPAGGPSLFACHAAVTVATPPVAAPEVPTVPAGARACVCTAAIAAARWRRSQLVWWAKQSFSSLASAF